MRVESDRTFANLSDHGFSRDINSVLRWLIEREVWHNPLLWRRAKIAFMISERRR